MLSPLVTVITPSYNASRFIRETVESVLNQGYTNLEYLVIDDGSTDDSRIMLPDLNYRRWENRVKLVLRNQNLGEQLTVNEGLKLVTGKYFMIVNADDPLLPGAIHTLVDFMEAHPDVLCAYPDWNSINENGTFKHHVQTREYDFSYMIRHHTWLMSVGSIFRASVIQSVGYRDTSYHWLGDADYWLRIGLVGKMARVPETLATWRHRGGQESGKRSSERAKEHIRLMHEFWQSFINPETKQPKAGNSYLWPYVKEATCWSLLVSASVTDSKLETVKCIRDAVRIYPKLLFSPEFYDALIQRASYILRR